jgi:uncharacterized protein with PIN domain
MAGLECHIGGMALSSTGIAEIRCEKCGARYRATYQDGPQRERGTFDCQKCGDTFWRWNGSRDWLDMKLID